MSLASEGDEEGAEGALRSIALARLEGKNALLSIDHTKDEKLE